MLVSFLKTFIVTEPLHSIIVQVSRNASAHSTLTDKGDVHLLASFELEGSLG